MGKRIFKTVADITRHVKEGAVKAKSPRTNHGFGYMRRYDLTVDPEHEFLITHGSVDTVALALLVCTEPGQSVAVINPSFSRSYGYWRSDANHSSQVQSKS